jgi:hypothetical protein
MMVTHIGSGIALALLMLLPSQSETNRHVATADDQRSSIIVGENVKVGMTLHSAISLLGAPRRIVITDQHTMLVPFDKLGMAVELASNDPIVGGLHFDAAFEGQFEDGLRIGSSFQAVIERHGQPDVMTRDRIEYQADEKLFQLENGRVVGVSLYLPDWCQSHKVGATEEHDASAAARIALFGMEVSEADGVVKVVAVEAGSRAEFGGLKVGDVISRVHEYRGLAGKGPDFEIQSIAGLNQVLSEAIDSNWREIWVIVRRRNQILNSVCKLSVPRDR